MSRKWLFQATRQQTANVIVKASSKAEARERGRKLMEAPTFWETYGEPMGDLHPRVVPAEPWHSGVPEVKEKSPS